MSTPAVRRLLAILLALAALGAACSSSDDDGAAELTTTEGGTEETEETTDTTAPEDETDETGETDEVVDDGTTSGAARCEANEAAGTITYITSFDYAASAGILDVVVAEAEGYFDEMCLDVEIQTAFAPGNGALVAAGQGQISAAGSFGELVNHNVQGDAGLIAIGQYGHTGIEALVVPADGVVSELTDLPGTTVGIKGDLPYSIQSMLGLAGVERGSFEELVLEGFDPIAHLELGIDALPVYKSNEPNTLEQAGVEFTMFDPLDYDVPASFGVFFTSESFLSEHPTAVQDFLRASFHGFEFALENPDTAIGYAFELIDAAGNPNFLFAETETYRWTTESALVVDTTPDGAPLGAPATDRLGEEVALLTEVGVFDGEPDWASMVDTAVVEGVYEGTELIWPGPIGE